MATKNIILAATIFACSLTLVKAAELPGSDAENGPRTKYTLNASSTQKASCLFVARNKVKFDQLKYQNFFNPRHK